MTDSHSHPNDLANVSREEIMSALFTNMIRQQTNLVMMMLGKVPHPATGEFLRELEGAKLFIDQLEMLEVKTKGNLGKTEEAMLKQSLMALHMAFVEAVNAPVERAAAAIPKPEEGQAADPTGSSPSEPSVKSAPGEHDSRKKFSKKY